jgi:hypothetical protein
MKIVFKNGQVLDITKSHADKINNMIKYNCKNGFISISDDKGIEMIISIHEICYISRVKSKGYR